MTSAPDSFSFSIADEISCRAAAASAVFTNAWSVFSSFPLARGILPVLLICFTRAASSPLPRARIPATATSPSSNALVACVVPWAIKTTSSGAWAIKITSSGLMRLRRRRFCKTVMIPSATPSSEPWVVGSFSRAMISPVSLSIATASVKVPPTSMPIRILLIFCRLLSYPAALPCR